MQDVHWLVITLEGATKIASAVAFRGVSKKFVIDKGKSRSFQEVFVNLFRPKAGAEQFWALRDVSFDVHAGKTVGIIGNNGSGKSTALKLISGILRPTAGTLQVNGRVSALLELGAGFHPDLSGRENVFLSGTILGMRQSEMKRRFDEIVAFSEMENFIEMPVKHYSSGMYMRLAFAVATSVEPDILLVDEVLAVGDSNFKKKCFDRIKSFQKDGRTIVFISHDLSSVTEISSSVIWLHKGVVRAHGAANQVVNDYLEWASVNGRSALQEETITATSEQPVRITRVDLQGADGDSRIDFRTGEELVISISYVCADPTLTAGFGVTIARSDGTYCYATNTRTDGIPPVELKNEGEIKLSLKPLTLLAGTFFIHVAIFEPMRHGYYDFREHAAMFKVQSSRNDFGVAILPHKWHPDVSSLPPTLLDSLHQPDSDK